MRLHLAPLYHLNVFRCWAEEERRNFKRARGVQGVKERQNRGTLEEQQGDIRCTAEVHKMNDMCIAEVHQRPYTELRIQNTDYYYMSNNNYLGKLFIMDECSTTHLYSSYHAVKKALI